MDKFITPNSNANWHASERNLETAHVTCYLLDTLTTTHLSNTDACAMWDAPEACTVFALVIDGFQLKLRQDARKLRECGSMAS